MDTLANLQVGGSGGAIVTQRFRAGQSSTLTAIRSWFKNMGTVAPGYGAGDGGAIQVTVQTDNGGVPSGTVLASTVHYPGAANGSGINPGRFSLVTFSAPASLTAGTLYHLVFRNIHADPVNNFSSMNLTYTYSAASPRQPKFPDADYAVGMKVGSNAWQVPWTGHGGSYSPILDLTYGNGTHQGQGYMEPELNSPAITGANNMVRERFTVSGGSRVVTSASVRLAKTSGTGNLVVRLEDSNGALIDSASIPTTSLPTLNRTADASAGIWVSGSFSAPRTLANGATYNLRLSTDASTSLWSRGIQQGDAYGFHPATVYTDGVLQATTNGGSSWTTVTGLDSNGDLQFNLD
jgi:hypothetical protein